MSRELVIAIAVSELVSLWIIWCVWRAPGNIAHKIGVTVVALIPFFGPPFALFLSVDPGPAHPAFRDYVRTRTDVLDRWHHIFEEKDPVRRFRRWQELMQRRDHDGA